MNKWVKWSALATLAAAVVGGVAIAGYATRYRPLGEPRWSVVALDAYTLQYVCVRIQEGRFPGNHLDWIIVHEASCDGIPVDRNIGLFHPDCRIEGTQQICQTPEFQESIKVDPQDLQPGARLDGLG